MNFLRFVLGCAVLGMTADGASMVDPTFDVGAGADNYAEHVLEMPDGKVLVCGGFTKFDNKDHPWIVRLNEDGSVDDSFVARPDFWTRHMVIQPDGKIVIAGFFTSVNGLGRNLIARLNADGTLDTSFNPGRGFEQYLAPDIYGNTQANVMWIELQTDGKILAAGDFKMYDGTSANGFVRINPDGTRDTTFNIGGGLDSWGRFVRVLPDGDIILTGWFQNYNGQSFNRIVRLFPDGTPDHTFNAFYGDKTSVYAAVVLPDGKVITAGHSLNTTFTREVVRLNTNGTIDPEWIGTTNEKTESLLLQDDGKLIMGGYFWLVDGTSSHSGIARLNVDGSVDETFTAQTDDLVWTVSPARNNKILISGGFLHVDGIPRGMVARLILPGAATQTTGDEALIRNASIRSAGFECTVNSVSGYAYTLQFKTSLDASGWTSLDPVSGTGSALVLKDPNPDEKRFYRVLTTKL